MVSNDPPPSPSTPPSPPPILVPALKVGVATGGAGFLLGGLIATLRSNPTVGLFAAGTGLNCFALGSSYWAIRATMMRVYQDPKQGVTELTPEDMLRISGASGALTGFTLGLALRGKSNALPGAIVWGLVGLGGQYAYDRADSQRAKRLAAGPPQEGQNKGSLSDRIFNSKWSPVKKLSNEDYKKRLEARLLSIEAEIALTDEEIDRVKAQNVDSKFPGK